jgi:hypothetical protein
MNFGISDYFTVLSRRDHEGRVQLTTLPRQTGPVRLAPVLPFNRYYSEEIKGVGLIDVVFELCYFSLHAPT